MLTRRVIPCLDVRDSRVVKGVRFQGIRDAGDPAALAARYEAEGADELMLLDISATPEGRGATVEIVSRVRRALTIPLTVGGGVRAIEDVDRLLNAGADKVGINSAAVASPDLIGRCADRFGRQCIVVTIDAARAASATEDRAVWNVLTRCGTQRTGLDAIAWSRTAAELGAGELLLTSWDRDGTRTGYDLDLTRAVAAAVGVPVIASGGAAGPEHLLAALRVGADAVLAASIFHDGEFTVRAVKEHLAAHGVEVRL